MIIATGLKKQTRHYINLKKAVETDAQCFLKFILNIKRKRAALESAALLRLIGKDQLWRHGGKDPALAQALEIL